MVRVVPTLLVRPLVIYHLEAFDLNKIEGHVNYDYMTLLLRIENTI